MQRKNTEKEIVGLRTGTDAIACGVFSKHVRLLVDVLQHYSTTSAPGDFVHQWRDAAGRVWELRHISIRYVPSETQKRNPRK